MLSNELTSRRHVGHVPKSLEIALSLGLGLFNYHFLNRGDAEDHRIFLEYCKSRVCNLWSAGQKWPWSWNFVARGKVQILKQALWFSNGIANLPWVASELSYSQILTQAAVARGTIWLRIFGPGVLHSCTPLL